MSEGVFGLGGLFIGSTLGFFGRLYFERRAERRADTETARRRREEQVKVVDTFLRHVEQVIWEAGLILKGRVARSGRLLDAQQGMADQMGLAYGAVNVLGDEIGTDPVRKDAFEALWDGLSMLKDAFEGAFKARKAKDETAFNAATTSSIHAITDVRRALGVLTRP